MLPSRLNGYDVIKAERCGPEDFVAVMVKRPNEAQPYVVATWRPHMGTQWHQGAYSQGREEADHSFDILVNRYGRL